MIELDEKTYIVGYWFASKSNDDCCYIIMTKKGDEWIGQLTFRYHSGNDDPFSGDDEKKISIIKFPKEKSEEELIASVNKTFEFLKKQYSFFNDMFLVKDNLDKFFTIARTKHYLHFKEVGKEELN